MNLLTFAHRGEAQQFLKVDNYQPVEFSFNGLHKNKESYLLIIGEGLESAKERMAAFLSQPNLSVSKVFNLGIAGALDENLNLESIHRVKQIFNENANETFRTSDVYAEIDCISALDRVNDANYRNRLVKNAQIVDRELWAIAKVCDKNQLPFYSFKLISDYAYSPSDLQKIIQNSKLHSKNLYNFFKEIMTKQDI